MGKDRALDNADNPVLQPFALKRNAVRKMVSGQFNMGEHSMGRPAYNKKQKAIITSYIKRFANGERAAVKARVVAAEIAEKLQSFAAGR